MKNKIIFPWQYEEVSGFGKIFRPYIPIQLKTLLGWKKFDFLVDSGADISMIPYSMKIMLGIKLPKTSSISRGIGGSQVKIWKTEIPIKINNWEMEIPVAVTQDNLTPLLLGRTGTLNSKFSWYFNHLEQRIEFIK